jgi:hypothetical protein
LRIAFRGSFSRKFLRDIVVPFPSRRITVASERQPNCIVLRIQSAYVLANGLTKRQEKAGKVAFQTLLRSTCLGKTIRG